MDTINCPPSGSMNAPVGLMPISDSLLRSDNAPALLAAPQPSASLIPTANPITDLVDRVVAITDVKSLSGYVIAQYLSEPPRAYAPLSRIAPKHWKQYGWRNEWPTGRCYWCRKRGHTKSFCPLFVRAKDAHPFARRIIDTCSQGAHAIDGDMKLSHIRSLIEAVGGRMNHGNPWAIVGEPLRRYELAARAGYWRAIGCHDTILLWITSGVPLRPCKRVERIAFRNHRSYEDHIAWVDTQMDKFSKDGSYIRVDARACAIINPLQVEPKKTGDGHRLCMDARYINSYLAHPEFRYESLRNDAASTIRPGDMMFTIDLESAYYSVPLHADSWQYVAWCHDGNCWVSTVLPFGVNVAPFIFQKIVRDMVTFLRRLHIRVINYLDDFIIFADAQYANEVLEFVLWLFRQLGWRVNAKSVLQPSTETVFLGLIIDSTRMCFRCPADRIDAVRRDILSVTSMPGWCNGVVERRKLRVIAGRLQSMKLALPITMVWTREMHRLAGGVDDSPMTVVTDALIDEFDQWTYITSLPLTKLRSSIRTADAEVELYVDASDASYGAHCGEVDVSGFLPADAVDGEHSSTYRELLGLSLAATHHAIVPLIKNRNVRIIMDSAAAIANLTKHGGPVKQLVDVIKRWERYCDDHKIIPSYEWTRREHNQRADWLSKSHNDMWMLRSDVIDIAYKMWHRRVGDVKHCCIANPRWGAITSEIQRLKHERAITMMVFPIWPARPWWPVLQSLIIDEIPHRCARDMFRTRMDHEPCWQFGLAIVDCR
jgi:hypothetical protein